MPEKSWRNLSVKHPLARLKAEVSNSKLPLPVRRQVWDLFRQVKLPGAMTPQDALSTARRLECTIQLLRIRYALMQHLPNSRDHFTLSKSASIWYRNLDKCMKDNGKNGHQMAARQPVMTAPVAADPRAENETDSDETDYGAET